MDTFDCCYKLGGAITKSALRAYMLDVDAEVEKLKKTYYKKNGCEKLTQKQKQTVESKFNYLTKDKNDAIYFFTKSPLFKTLESLGLNFEYLVKEADEILKEEDD